MHKPIRHLFKSQKTPFLTMGNGSITGSIGPIFKRKTVELAALKPGRIQDHTSTTILTHISLVFHQTRKRGGQPTLQSLTLPAIKKSRFSCVGLTQRIVQQDMNALPGASTMPPPTSKSSGGMVPLESLHTWRISVEPIMD